MIKFDYVILDKPPSYSRGRSEVATKLGKITPLFSPPSPQPSHLSESVSQWKRPVGTGLNHLAKQTPCISPRNLPSFRYPDKEKDKIRVGHLTRDLLSSDDLLNGRLLGSWERLVSCCLLGVLVSKERVKMQVFFFFQLYCCLSKRPSFNRGDVRVYQQKSN